MCQLISSFMQNLQCSHHHDSNGVLLVAACHARRLIGLHTERKVCKGMYVHSFCLSFPVLHPPHVDSDLLDELHSEYANIGRVLSKRNSSALDNNPVPGHRMVLGLHLLTDWLWMGLEA